MSCNTAIPISCLHWRAAWSKMKLPTNSFCSIWKHCQASDLGWRGVLTNKPYGNVGNHKIGMTHSKRVYEWSAAYKRYWTSIIFKLCSEITNYFWNVDNNIILTIVFNKTGRSKIEQVICVLNRILKRSNSHIVSFLPGNHKVTSHPVNGIQAIFLHC